MNTAFPKSGSQLEFGPNREQENAAGLWGRMKQLLARLFPDRFQAQQAREEYKRQEMMMLRQRLRAKLHHRLDK